MISIKVTEDARQELAPIIKENAKKIYPTVYPRVWLRRSQIGNSSGRANRRR
jgi:hypothetical protein